MPIIIEPIVIVSGVISMSLAGVAYVFGIDFGFPFAILTSDWIFFAMAYLPSQIIWYVFSSLQIDFFMPSQINRSLKQALTWDRVIISLVTGTFLIPLAFLTTYLFLLSPLAFNVLIIGAITKKYFYVLRPARG